MINIKKKNNIVIIGGKTDKIELYEHAILSRMNPFIYNEFGEIIIQCIPVHLEFTEVILKKFKWAGLQEVERRKAQIKTSTKDGEGYTLPNAYEIVLKKIPVLELLGDK